MTNDEFQKTVKKGDMLVVQEGNTREQEGTNFKFVRFSYCQHHKTTTACRHCMGQIVYENRESYKGFTSEGCQREFNDPKKNDYLVIKVDIIPGSEWINDVEWEII